MDLRDGKPGVGQIGDLGEEGEIAAGGLGAAFDDVPGGNCSGDGVVIFPVPTEVRRGWSDDHRCVGDAPGDDDVGAGVQTVDDAPGAQIGVGR